MMPRASRRQSAEGRARETQGSKEGCVGADAYIDFATVYDEWQALYPRPFAVALAPRIVRAATQLVPDPDIETSESGTRHRNTITATVHDDDAPAPQEVTARARAVAVVACLPGWWSSESAVTRGCGRDSVPGRHATAGVV
mgnify:CR=1 FL=1